MPRIRSIKPEFWQDQRLARLDSLTRLVYVCLWSMADDEGRIEGDAETVWHFGFPREKPEAIAKALRALAECSRVVPYTGGEDQKYLFIPRFSLHQRIDHPTRSKLPAPTVVTPAPGTLANPPVVLANNPGRIGSGKGLDQGEDQGGEGVPEEPGTRSDPLIVRILTFDIPAWRADRRLHDSWAASVRLANPGLDLEAEVGRAATWWVSNPARTRGKTAIARFLGSWFSRAGEYAKNGSGNGNGRHDRDFAAEKRARLKALMEDK